MRNSSLYQNLYNKVHIVKGDNYITIENTSALTEDEMIIFIQCFADDESFHTYDHMTLLVNDKFSDKVEQALEEKSFKFHAEQVMVTRSLLSIETPQSFIYQYKSLNDLQEAEFMDAWEKTMRGSLNAPSTLNMKEQMKGVELELGPNYKDSCLIAYENVNPIGVVMPHIEPGTKDEGRLFYFGLIPNERGKGKSPILHYEALCMLKNQFHASYYIGGTGGNNKPMLKTFHRNGCQVKERNKVYKKSRGS